MNRIKEIEARKLEIKSLLEDTSKQVDVDALQKELSDLDEELRKLEEEIKTKDEEERKLEEERRKQAQMLEKRNAHTIENKEKKMEKKSLGEMLASKEYRDYWAKKLMGLKLTEEERALGDAVTTTATEFVQAAEGVQGINNGGLFIPTEIRTNILTLIERVSPLFKDVQHLAVAGNIDLPYLNSADDAEWYVELTDTKNEGQEYKRIQLTGYELAKDVVMTWKVEAMTIDAFINFVSKEIANKMQKAICKAIIYGNGSNKATGITHGLTKITGTNPIDLIKAVKLSLSEDARVGAKCYISEEMADEIHFYKDGNNFYPYLAGLPKIANLVVEVEPFLENKEVIVGNPSAYVFNEVKALEVVAEKKVVGRRTIYGAYMIADGKPKPNCFAWGGITPASI